MRNRMKYWRALSFFVFMIKRMRAVKRRMRRK